MVILGLPAAQEVKDLEGFDNNITFTTTSIVPYEIEQGAWWIEDNYTEINGTPVISQPGVFYLAFGTYRITYNVTIGYTSDPKSSLQYPVTFQDKFFSNSTTFSDKAHVMHQYNSPYNTSSIPSSVYPVIHEFTISYEIDINRTNFVAFGLHKYGSPGTYGATVLSSSQIIIEKLERVEVDPGQPGQGEEFSKILSANRNFTALITWDIDTYMSSPVNTQILVLRYKVGNGSKYYYKKLIYLPTTLTSKGSYQMTEMASEIEVFLHSGFTINSIPSFPTGERWYQSGVNRGSTLSISNVRYYGSNGGQVRHKINRKSTTRRKRRK